MRNNITSRRFDPLVFKEFNIGNIPRFFKIRSKKIRCKLFILLSLIIKRKIYIQMHA